MKTRKFWLSVIGMALIAITGAFIIGCNTPVMDANINNINESVIINIPVENGNDDLNTGSDGRIIAELLFPQFKVTLTRLDVHRVRAVLTNITSTGPASVTYRLQIERNGILQYDQYQSITGVPAWSGEGGQTTYIANWTKATISNIVITQGANTYTISGPYVEY
jgi:hypothetical protein